MPVGPRFEGRYLSEKEAQTYRKVKKIAYQISGIGAVASLLLCAVGGLTHYFGGKEVYETANEITKSGLITLGFITALTLTNSMTIIFPHNTSLKAKNLERSVSETLPLDAEPIVYESEEEREQLAEL